MSTSNAGHAPPEALSAFLDGEAREWAAHLEGCARCQAELSRLGDVAAAVGQPVPPLPAPVVDRAVVRALEAAGPGSTAAGPAGPPPVASVDGRRRRPTRMLLGVASGSIAAVLLAVLAAFAVFGNGDDERVDTALAPAPEAVRDRAATGAAAPPVTVSGDDLGEVGDAGALAGRLRGRIPGTGGAPTAMAAAPEAGGTASSAASPATGPAPSAASPATGPAPCEAAARASAPGLGPLVYVAEGSREGRPVVVLGFSGRGPVTLLVLTTDGCGPVFSTEVS